MDYSNLPNFTSRIGCVGGFDILTAISITHDKLVNIGLGSLRPLGATLVGFIFTKNLVTIFSLGDSACYHLNGDKLVNLTEDVKSSKPHFNVIEQCLGGGITKPNPSIVKRKFKIGDVFILTSDGVSNWADKEQIKMTIQSKQLSFSRKLCSIAKKSGSNDDLSAVVIKIKSL